MFELSTYLNENQTFPYCNGCGHTMINKAVAKAMQKSNLKATAINLISDIGCVGLVDKMFLTNTIHTTHGRSTAVATGINLADEILYKSKSPNIIMIGDGGATIGLLHLVEAAKMNANLTVILHNNFVYGMTGGQNSGLTPENFKTATTLQGNLVPNIHIAKLLEAAHAGFIARKLATDQDLDDTILEAINYDGFALIEIVELCTGYATKWNDLSKKEIEKILENTDQEQRGILLNDKTKTSFSKKYQQAFKENTDYKKPAVINSDLQASDLKLNLILAGTAGEGIQFSSSLFATSLVKNGFHISQKNDNPVTIGTGYSITELKLAKDPILYSQIDQADYILVSSQDGYNRVKDLINEQSQLIIDSEIYSNNEKSIKAKNIYQLETRATIKDKRLIMFALINQLYKLETKLNYQLFIEELKNSKKITDAFIEDVLPNP